MLGHGAAEGNPRSLAAERMAELVDKYSDGELELRIQGSEQLGSDVQMLQQVQSGAIGLTANSQGALATIVPKANVFGLPFLFDSPQAAWQVADGPIGDEVEEQAEQRGLKVLAWWSNGMRQFTNNVRPIEEPQDLEGLKMRTSQDAVTIDTLSTLGANPTPMAFGELYVALKQGMVDGQENPVVNIMSSNLDEVQQYLSLSDYRYETTPVVIGMPTWQRLSEENRQALQKAARETTDFQRQTLIDQTDELLAQIRENGVMEVNSVDTAAFREATRPVYDTWQEKLGEIVPRAREAAEQANQQQTDSGADDQQ
ncbi:tripartite ATP-independent transporter DctP family solute receptor [Kushneria sinocarnis]|uniref:Tripartite ATP-independent transporter DctP family solute receptor n=1 Tax=Kushneria sinocarnis TaxID=595502 RepID=A0A420WVY9_9GAMM|nr:TRAP transporter substrate-binding protein [Kushneria sinocarnis]RKR03274.1 tripartite ATP-independent transporter DctP family solute receptor [Kushneria sinocarnis]